MAIHALASLPLSRRRRQSEPSSRCAGIWPRSRAGGGAAGEDGRLPIVLYFHGGGLVVGTAADAPDHAFLNRLAARAGALAVSVEYRLAPEHPVPACYDDAWAAFLWATSSAAAADPWVRDHGDAARAFVLGFSSGANVAHNLTIRAGSEPDSLPRGARVEGMALVHPYALAAEGAAYHDALLGSGWAATDAELLDSTPADHEFHLWEPDSAKTVILMDRLVVLITGRLLRTPPRRPGHAAAPTTAPISSMASPLCVSRLVSPLGKFPQLELSTTPS